MKHKFLLIFLVYTSFTSTKAQNLFDSTNTEKYANYLFVNQEYILAKEEFERLIFLKVNLSDTIYYKHLKSLRLSGETGKAYLTISTLDTNKIFESKLLSKEYFTILIKNKNYHLVPQISKKSVTLSENEKIFYEVSASLYAENFKKSEELIMLYPDNELLTPYKDVLQERKKIRYKNPYVSSSLSAIIPGLGQTYSGNWKDGIITLLFTGSSAYQSYRGFTKYGANSLYGWIFGAVATGFYVGNIYGAAKASNKYNFLKNIKISLQIETIFDNYN